LANIDCEDKEKLGNGQIYFHKPETLLIMTHPHRAEKCAHERRKAESLHKMSKIFAFWYHNIKKCTIFAVTIKNEETCN